LQRVQYHQYGGPEVLKVEGFTLPEPAPGQVRVKVMAAAANPMDWKIRKGEMKFLTGSKFPRGLGHDFAGIIDAVGTDVTRLKVGDEVFGATGIKESGTFAEAALCDQKTTFIKPRAINFEEAASLPIVTATAWTALVEKAKLRAGQRVLITGCLGGVGHVSVQLALMRGATVVGSSSASRRDESLALGVSEAVDYRAFDASKYKNSFDVIFDTHGSLSISQCNEMLRHGGVVLHIVPTPLKMIYSVLFPRHKVIFAHLTPESMVAVSAAIEQGKITPQIGKVVPLSDAISAIIDFEKNGLSGGKLVISPME